MAKLVDVLDVERHASWLHDFGSQIGLRYAIAHPERIAALVISNGDIYADTLGRDLPDAELHLLDAGHWVLEARLQQCIELLDDFLTRTFA